MSSPNGGAKYYSQRGFVLPTAAIFFIVGIPLAGLAIDLGSFYLIQSRLQSSADAAALAGARALARGTDPATQITNAQTAARNYMTANFPAGYMGVQGLTVPTPTVVNGGTNM